MKVRVNLKIVIIILAILLVAAMTSESAPTGQDPDVADTLIIDSVIVYGGDTGAIVPVYFVNDEELAGIEVTLAYDTADVVLDSFSFVGGRVEALTIQGADYAPGTVSIYCFPMASDPFIQIGGGRLGNLYFSISPTAMNGMSLIDTTTIVRGDIEYSTVFSDVSAITFTPQIVEGWLDLQLDRCCIGTRGDVNGDGSVEPDIVDLTAVVDYLFGIPPILNCLDEADINGDGSSGGLPDIVDLTFIVDYMFGVPPALVDCP